MTDIRLTMPMNAQQARALKVGDTVLVDGDIVVSAGLPTYQRIAEYLRDGRALPIDLNNGVLFHLGSYSRETADGGIEVLYINPTTSTRFNPLMPGIIRGLKLHAVGGKGGLDAECANAMQEAGCVYLSFPGGGSALLSQALREVRQVAWPELITHYRLVKLRVEGLGPATVAIDAHGNSLYDDLQAGSRQRMADILAGLAQDRQASGQGGSAV
ncbi:MAG: fumarate hydratase C-terminal domain-containing protein [Burkholderiaceae bacterium]